MATKTDAPEALSASALWASDSPDDWRAALDAYAQRRDALNHAVLFSEWNALQPRVEPQVLLHRQRVVQRVVLRANPENAVPERTNELHK